MWLAMVFGLIAVVGTTFLLWFLVGLLREGPPWTYWTVSAPEAAGFDGINSMSSSEDAGCHHGDNRQYNPADCYVELLENKRVANEIVTERITLKYCDFPGNLGGSAIHSRNSIIH